MPISTRAGQPVYYEVHGDGFPVLMITGMAARMDWFHYNIPALAERYQVVAQDLRGSNRDGVPATPGPYTTRDMARDSIGILDDLGIEQAHVVALSLGGMIAQWLAVDHPDRVAHVSIVGNGLARMPPEVAEMATGAAGEDEPLARMHEEEKSEEATLGLVLETTFTKEFPEQQPQRWEFFRRTIIGNPARPETHRAQLAASFEHDAIGHLGGIRSRVQLLAGDLDAINAEYAPEMAAALPHCDLRILPGMNHGLTIEFAETYNDLVLRFLDS